MKPIEAQVTTLRKLFPSLGSCMVRIGRRPLPEGAEAWFAIPRWQALAPTYEEAVELVLETLAQQRKFANRMQGRLAAAHLRPIERSERAFAISQNSSRQMTSWWWARKWDDCIAAVRRGAPGSSCWETNSDWACSPSRASSLRTPSGYQPERA